MHNQPFTVAGMSSSTSSHHSPNLNTWGSSSTGGPLSSSFTDSLSQSRSHYQSGYLMSAQQNNNVPQGNQRVDEVPVVPTKAKMNQILTRGSTTEFGIESMFQSSRQRQPLADEDAPPTSSINDIPTEFTSDSGAPFQPRKTISESSSFNASRRQPLASSTAQSNQPVYVYVFGYPADKYSVAAEYFRSLGAITEAESHPEVINCFRIGFKDAGDAGRVVRKNGDVIGGTWMVGVKWADPLLAETMMSPAVNTRAAFSANAVAEEPSGNDMAVDDHTFSPPRSSAGTPSVGTPIKLAPSTSAFRKNTGVPASKPSTPHARAWGNSAMPTSNSAPGAMNTIAQPSPSKSVMGQVSDLIFGW
ncbi:hypothetical protein CVT24_005811 [Panaeolus cyanescens]|uniref:RRM Nup35-type domain-containing protein n=1 Tax=Panaeolus cyanescens TaxID=181874 RepID=A0A409VDK5_9AGAR|nr:hypothetical protein CVT24_005811 [Panaeolus cyanescens]